MGRFINADSYLNANGDMFSYNLFAYCANNPIMRVDPTGHAWYDIAWDWVNTIAGLMNPVSDLIAVATIIASIFNGNWDGLVEDFKAGRLNPFNQDAALAGEANVLSFYKGSTVVNQSVVSTCSALGTIWKSGREDANTIMHEYGHSIQERILGVFYWTNVAFPSMLYYKLGSSKDIDYYSTPWERTADWLGGVNRNCGYKKGSLAWSIAENLMGPNIIPFYFMLGYLY